MSNNTNKKVIDKNKILQCTLGLVNYYELVDFFDEVLEKVKADNAVAIFTTRRCQLLFYLYCSAIKKIDPNSFNNIKCISDKAIHFCALEMEQDVAYIIDDILIHGRTLLGVIRRTKKYFKKINIEVFAQNIECNFSEELEKERASCEENFVFNFNAFKKINDNLWRIMSNRIVSSLILTSTPYVAYTYSYIKNEVSIDEFNNIIDALETSEDVEYKDIIDLSLNESESNNKISELIENRIKAYFYKLKDNNSQFSCLRIYYNDLTQQLILLPTSYIYSYTKEEIDFLCYSFFEHKSKINTVEKYHPKYRALTALYSLKFFEIFNSKNSIFNLNEFNVNYDQIDYNYYQDFFKELCCALKKDVDILKFKKEEKELNFNQHYQDNFDDVYIYNFYKTIEKLKEDEYIEFIELIKQIDLDEEETLINDKKSLIERKPQKGLPLVLINSFFLSKDNILRNKFYRDIVRGSDTGLISVYPEEFQKAGVFCNYCITGEQACRLYQDKYTIFIKK